MIKKIKRKIMFKNFKSILVLLVILIGFASCREVTTENVEDVTTNDSLSVVEKTVVLTDSVEQVNDTLVQE